MSESTEELRARVAALETENAALRSTELPQGRPPRRSRAIIATILIVLGVLLAPVAVVTGWAKWTLTDTERFVATYAPLADSPAVQSHIVDQAMVAVDEQVDIDGLTQQLVDGLIALGTGPQATAALRTLQGTAAGGLRSLIHDGMTEFVTSDQFSAVWAESLRIAHTQLIGTLSNDPDAVATISEDGSLGIPLAPIVEQVKAALVARGITIAERIPTVDRTIVIVQSDQLPTVQLVYGIIVAVGTWLPWVSLALMTGGVLVANRRPRALLWTGVAFAFAMFMLALALAAGRLALLAAVPASVLPGSVSGLFYDTATDAMRNTAVSAAVLGLAVAVVGWFAGPFRAPTKLRLLYADSVARLRVSAEERGVSTGRVGVFVHRWRSLLLGVIAFVAGLVIVLNRPVDVALIGWTAFWAVLAVVVVTLVERPGVQAAPSVDPGQIADAQLSAEVKRG